MMEFSPRKTKSRAYCSVYGCNSKAYKNDTIRFYNFPKKDRSVVKIVNKFNEEELIDRQAAWIKILEVGKKVNPSCMRVCSLHFTPQDFIPSRGRVHHLKKISIPSLNLPSSLINTKPNLLQETQAVSREERFQKRRMQLKEIERSMQVFHDAENNKPVNPWSSAKLLLPDQINSEINTMMTYHLQMNEGEAADNNEELTYDEIIEIIEYYTKDSVHVDNNIKYNEEDARNETIEYCEDKDFVSVNIDNNVKQTEGYNEGGTPNETIEYCEDNKDLVFANIDNNVKQTEGYNEGGTRNETIEFCEDNKDLVFANIDNNVKQTEGHNEKGIRNETTEYCEDNKDFVFINTDNIKTEEYNEESTHNETIEFCEDNKDLVFANIDNNEKQTEKYNEEGAIERTEGYREGTHSQDIEYSIEKSIDNNCSKNPFNICENIPTGRCIIDISFVWSEFHRVFNNHARGIDCQFKYWKLTNYRRRGLLTQFFFKCQMCRYQASIWSEPMGTNTPDINAAAVAASAAAGMGFSRLRKFFTSMDIACMSEKTYIKHRNNLNTVQKDATKNMIKK